MPAGGGAAVLAASSGTIPRPHGADRHRVGTEVLCRLSLVVPKAVHRRFHPTAIFGAMGARRVARRRSHRQQSSMRSATPSMAGGHHRISRRGAGTKRLHAGWGAQSGFARRYWRGQGWSAAHGVPRRARAFMVFAHPGRQLRGADRRFRTRW